MALRFEHPRFVVQILMVMTVCLATTASADSVIVCGDQLGAGSEVTVAQWISGADSLAPIVTRSHWRIFHRKITGNYCPVFEIDLSQKVYIRAQQANGSIRTASQFGMYSLEAPNNPRYTGDYQLFLETELNPSNNTYQWYKEPMLSFDDGVVRASPTVGLSMTEKWETQYPIKNGFEERSLQSGDNTIVVQ